MREWGRHQSTTIAQLVAGMLRSGGVVWIQAYHTRWCPGPGKPKARLLHDCNHGDFHTRKNFCTIASANFHTPLILHSDDTRASLQWFSLSLSLFLFQNLYVFSGNSENNSQIWWSTTLIRFIKYRQTPKNQGLYFQGWSWQYFLSSRCSCTFLSKSVSRIFRNHVTWCGCWAPTPTYGVPYWGHSLIIE